MLKTKEKSKIIIMKLGELEGEAVEMHEELCSFVSCGSEIPRVDRTDVFGTELAVQMQGRRKRSGRGLG